MRGERVLTVFPSPMSSPCQRTAPFPPSIAPAPLQLCLDLGIGNQAQAHGSREESNIRENSRPRTAQTFPRPPGKSAALFMEDLTSFHTWRREEEEHAILLPHQCPGGTCGGTRAVKETRGTPQTVVSSVHALDFGVNARECPRSRQCPRSCPRFS